MIIHDSSTGNTRSGVDIIRQEIERSGGTCQLRKVNETGSEEMGAKDLTRLSMGRVKVVESRFGRCAAECPVGTIELCPYPVLREACIGCWACFNLCPQRTITSNLAKNRRPYRGMREYHKVRIEESLDRD